MVFRFLVRYTVFRKLFADDALVALAWILLLIFAAFWQTRAEDLYGLIPALHGALPDAGTARHILRFQKAQILTLMIYGVSLWSIKLAFLLFFRRLGDQVQNQAKIWWAVLSFNTASFIVWIGYQNWHCYVASTAVAQGRIFADPVDYH